MGHSNQDATPQEGAAIARQLTGELYCIGCGYNLHGLSIRSNCSECGIPVRATILGIVDPKANELVPLFYPKVTAIGLNMWSFGAGLAVVMVWVLRGAEAWQDMLGSAWAPRFAALIGIVGLVISMIGGASMIRSHKGVTRKEVIKAAIGVSLYAPLILLYGELYAGFNFQSSSALFSPESSLIAHSILRLSLFFITAGVVICLRQAAVGLAVRSVVVRTGRVDRQSLLTVLAAMGIAAVGDVLQLFTLLLSGGLLDAVSLGSTVLVALGSVLFTLGLANICLDTLRLFPVLMRPGVGIGDIFETNQERSRRESQSKT